MLRLLEQGRLPQEIDRSQDRYFKFLLGRPERSLLLIDLLNSIFLTLGHPKLKSLTLLNTELSPENAGKKLAHLDIRATDEGGRQLVIELQNNRHKHFIERGLYYWARDYVETFDAGKGFSELKPTIVIPLLGFGLFEKEETSVWDFMLMNPGTGKILTRDELLIYVEMVKFAQALRELRKRINESDYKFSDKDRLFLWGGYITDSDAGVELLKDAATKDQIFQEVKQAEERYWNTPEARYLQFMEQLAELDRRAFIEDAMEEGRETGRKEGVEAGKFEIARNLLAHGISADIVAESVGLSLDQIQSLL
jgi:predicted transposase/invertase (TIGR01784 family)